MKKVEIYTSNSCSYCGMAKDYFQENNIEYTEYNVSENPQYRKDLMKKGYMSVPVIIIDEEEVIGFDKNRIEKLLEV